MPQNFAKFTKLVLITSLSPLIAGYDMGPSGGFSGNGEAPAVNILDIIARFPPTRIKTMIFKRM